MNEEVKALWVSALRSGDYEQTTGSLRDKVGFCCLGVLCDLAVEAGVARQTSSPSGKVAYLGYDIDDMGSGVPPEAVLEWAEMPGSGHDRSIGVFTVPEGTLDVGFRPALTGLNDENKLTFDQIADVVEYFF